VVLIRSALRGLGHPDYICDAIMDSVSVNLSLEYLKRFNMIAHHNIDKALLAAGEAEHRFGGGVLKKAMLLIFGDRATYEVGDEYIPVDEVAINTAKKWFRENLRFVNPDVHVKYQVELKRGSEALRDIFERKTKVLGANDTSAAVGYAPMTDTEKIVLETERFLNSKEFKHEHPESGEDVKVMGFRKGNSLELTIAMAFVDRFIESENAYFKRKEEILEEIERWASERYTNGRVKVYLNTLDRRGRGVKGVYLTVLGTCADDSDSGQVGRGNRVNGIIPLNRPISSEAAAGKNPVSHIGKIYNVLTYKIADRIYREVSGLKEVYVWLLSHIGEPIDRPRVAAVQVIPEKGLKIKTIREPIEAIIMDELDHIQDFCLSLAKGLINIC
jgi:S-adenosylmethionine synthetase